MEGIARYIYETTKRMVLAHPEDEFHFFFDRPYDAEFIFAKNVIPHVLSPPSRHPILWYLWFEFAVPRKLKEIQAEVFLSGDMYLSLRTKVPTVMVSHDLNYEHYPEFLPWTVRKYMEHYSPKYHLKASQLIAVSEATKKDIIDTYNIPANKITVATNSGPAGFSPLSTETKYAIRKKATDNQPYFVYVGSLHPRKNIERLLQAFDAFNNQTVHSHKLVIFGRWAFKTKKIKAALEKMNHKHAVVFLDDSKFTVPEIMGAAEALCYVSLFEGFGIPILEAFNSEIPVITSKVSAMPEVAGTAALLVDPYKVKEITAAMLKLSEDKSLSKALIAKGKIQKLLFDWDKSASAIYEVLTKTKT